jgi:hypothetical protein
MTEWDIQPRGSACSICQAPFVDKQPYHTLLSASAQGYQRRDLCADCHASTPQQDVVSYWKGVYKTPAPPPAEPIHKDTAETLLRRLVEKKDPTQAGACYILAVMLERKKILKPRDTVGEDVLVYEHAATAESFTVPDPHLRLDQLEEVQRQVAELLQPTAAAS